MSSALKALATRWPVATATASRSLVCRAHPSFTLILRPSHTLLARSPPLGATTAGPRIAITARSFSSTLRRSESSTTSAPKPASSSHASPAQDSSTPPPLDWETFFKLRLRRHRVQLTFSVLTCVLGGAVGVSILSSSHSEQLTTLVPLDPIFTLGLVTLACAGLGWLMGPFLGSQFFYLLNRQYKSQMLEKERGFFARIRKNRVDPSNSSAGNPVPDFYGEKIQSVAGYKQWLKDQRAFNEKKKADFV